MSSHWSFIDHLTNHLSRPRFGDEKHPTLWPSEASAVVQNKWGEDEVVGRCRRETFFRFAIANYKFNPEFQHLKPLVEELQTKELPVEKYLRWIWAAGELYEEYVVNLAKNSGVFIDTQVRIYIPEYNVSGLLDLITINPDNYLKSIVEVKSVYGYGGDAVLGSAWSRKNGELGKPKDSNLMQIALYDWHFASPRNDFEDSRLVYGSRDTGRYAEYRIRTEKIGDTTKIFYRGISPNVTKETESAITIDSILIDGYKYVTDHLLAGIVPPRDFDLQYSEEKLMLWLERDEQLDKSEQKLTKANREQLEKIANRKEVNEKRRSEGKKELKPLKSVERGDYQCKFCKFRAVCYNQDATPRDI